MLAEGVSGLLEALKTNPNNDRIYIYDKLLELLQSSKGSKSLQQLLLQLDDFLGSFDDGTVESFCQLLDLILASVRIPLNSQVQGKHAFTSFSDKLQRSFTSFFLRILVDQAGRSGKIPCQLQDCFRLMIRKNLIIFDKDDSVFDRCIESDMNWFLRVELYLRQPKLNYANLLLREIPDIQKLSIEDTLAVLKFLSGIPGEEATELLLKIPTDESIIDIWWRSMFGRNEKSWLAHLFDSFSVLDLLPSSKATLSFLIGLKTVDPMIIVNLPFGFWNSLFSGILPKSLKSFCSLKIVTEVFNVTSAFIEASELSDNKIDLLRLISRFLIENDLLEIKENDSFYCKYAYALSSLLVTLAVDKGNLESFLEEELQIFQKVTEILESGKSKSIASIARGAVVIASVDQRSSVICELLMNILIRSEEEVENVEKSDCNQEFGHRSKTLWNVATALTSILSALIADDQIDTEMSKLLKERSDALGTYWKEVLADLKNFKVVWKVSELIKLLVMNLDIPVDLDSQVIWTAMQTCKEYTDRAHGSNNWWMEEEGKVKAAEGLYSLLNELFSQRSRSR